jgi:hypothetical protein
MRIRSKTAQPAMNMTLPSPLAAVVYDKGFSIDEFMSAIARELRASGFRVGGVFQQNMESGASRPSTMVIIDMLTGERFTISQDLGPAARGCRLDQRGLLDAGLRLDAAVADIDLLLINKFGRGEAEGGGLRTTFAAAIESGVPVLTAVRAPYDEAWAVFHGGLAANLAPAAEEVLAWCRAAVENAGRRPARLNEGVSGEQSQRVHADEP